ncbi:MAG: hypothetical protein KJ000_30405 [Pirellulaceae bacterium]|nr:hypothetical protein [Pirellulaceae bacterium]
MRMNLAKVFQSLAVATGITVVALTGCSSTSSYKMPGADMFSWGKKKPADTSLAASNKTNLPAPPSTATTPHTPPNYAQTPSAGSPQARTASTAGATAPATSYGQPSGGTYANTGYPAAGGSSQGFYSPEYQPPSSAAGANGGYASQPGAMPPNAYSQAAAPNGGTTWNSTPTAQYAPPNAAGYANPAGQSTYAASGGYGPTSTAPPSGYSAPPNAALPPQSYSSNGSGYGDPSGSVYANSAAAQPAAPSQLPAWQNADAAGGYRPGSTARSTPYGSSDSLRVAEAPGIQPASFSGAGSQYPPAQGSYPPATTDTQPAVQGGSGYNYPGIYR